MDDRVRRLTEQNRRAWNEIADVRGRRWTEKHPDEQLRTAENLPKEVRSAIGAVEGKRLLHLQCATGEESIALAALGAIVTAVDISERQIGRAVQRSVDTGLAVEFVASDVYALPPELRSGSFDIVYTCGGVLTWLPDLAAWAHVIAQALSAGGRFVLFEEHPLAQTLAAKDGEIVTVGDYFQRGRVEVEPPGWAHFNDQGRASEEKYEFAWGIGDLVSALADAGLHIERLEEFPMHPEHQEWRFRGAMDKAAALPGMLLLIATAAGQPRSGSVTP
jgi:2-polyprenyl-3-methyl-5-hydroxy-6-metoxy-1,4-benzoquinol methylase